ncbi:MAG: DUF1585 domain-containing protein, partial [Gammaproteobacteria bacterium]|nr:DUF1585 domain-containing protein [Gammaproteobacteria bacterium]
LFDGSDFADTEGFKKRLLEHQQRFANTVTQKSMTYALGRSLEYYDQPAVREIVQKIMQNDYRWSALVLGIIESTPFQYRRVQP